jgi:hypothetical protein
VIEDTGGCVDRISPFGECPLCQKRSLLKSSLGKTQRIRRYRREGERIFSRCCRKEATRNVLGTAKRPALRHKVGDGD